MGWILTDGVVSDYRTTLPPIAAAGDTVAEALEGLRRWLSEDGARACADALDDVDPEALAQRPYIWVGPYSDGRRVVLSSTEEADENACADYGLYEAEEALVRAFLERGPEVEWWLPRGPETGQQPARLVQTGDAPAVFVRVDAWTGVIWRVEGGGWLGAANSMRRVFSDRSDAARWVANRVAEAVRRHVREQLEEGKQ